MLSRLPRLRPDGPVFRHVFTAQDPGMLMANSSAVTISLEERFVVPDIYGSSQSVDLEVQEVIPGCWWAYSPRSLKRRFRRHGTSVNVTGTRSRSRADGRSTTGLPQTCSVLLGGPGSGKSTVLRNLAIDLLREEPS